MSEHPHSPVPWVLVNSTSYAQESNEIRDANAVLLCCDYDYYPTAPEKHDMAHIVRCVNAHDMFVSSMREIERHCLIAVGSPNPEAGKLVCAATLRLVRAALAFNAPSNT